MRRPFTILPAVLVLALGLAACGDDEPETKTVVQTVTAPAATPSATPAATPDATTGASGATGPSGATGTAEALPPLPAGVTGIDGTYEVEHRRSDYEGENTTTEDRFGGDEWVFKTTCEAEDCTVLMRRELGNGSYKNVTLEPDADREGVFAGRSTGRTGCATSDARPNARQRYSVKINKTADVDGRPTGTVLDIYYSETTNGCKNRPASGTVSWRAVRESEDADE